jgi:hypothetical protein
LSHTQGIEAEQNDFCFMNTQSVFIIAESPVRLCKRLDAPKIPVTGGRQAQLFSIANI